MNTIKKISENVGKYALTFLKWLMISLLTGAAAGGAGVLFSKGLALANTLRAVHPEIILALPVAGVLIVFIYQISKFDDKGTNLVISAIHGEDTVPFRMAPLIFVSTILTHLTGGSAGREGAAVQLGGGIASFLSRYFRLSDKEKKIIIMCGISAGFSAVFGTPLAAVIFAVEVATVGRLQYSALFPCIISSLTAAVIAKLTHCHAEQFEITQDIDFTVKTVLLIAVLGMLCAAVGILFSNSLHLSSKWLKKLLPNPYIRILIGSAVIILLSIILKTTDYNGAGINLISDSFNGIAPNIAFLLKIIFTVITLSSGFKGGEIVPTLCIGATFGCLFASLTGLSPELCAAVGMVSLFCAVTNCPLTSLILGFELCGFGCTAFFIIGIAVSYVFSGKGGLYTTQKTQSKIKSFTLLNKSSSVVD